MKIKAIITGATGMVGEGVLHTCLNSPDVESVLVVNRKPCGVDHPKLKEIIHKDFLDLSPIENQLKEYDACFFCAGVSSIGKKEDEYKRITYDLTLNFAKTLIKINGSKADSSLDSLPTGRHGAREKKIDITFCYISGAGTDSTEKGRSMWGRVKGKTENDLLKLPFKCAYMYRPGYIQPIKGLKHTYKMYKFLYPIYPLLKKLFSKYVVTLEEIGNSMISVTLNGNDKKVLECEDIRKTGKV